MTPRELLLHRPEPRHQILLWLASLVLTGLIGYTHLRTGLAYEFHVFFTLPILIVAWYVNLRRAYVIAVLAVVLWYLADRQLMGESAERLPLIFNTGVRLTIFLGATWFLGQMRSLLDRESRLAQEDALTGLCNRRGFQLQGESLFSLARREALPLTAVFIDLDHFKEVNDRCGHDVGDRLLALVAKVLRQHCRHSDLAGRLGGDEFALLLPAISGEAAGQYAHRLREYLLAEMQAQGWPVTFSIGVADFDVLPDSLDAVLREADQLMYQVKQGGRNAVAQRSTTA